MWLWHHMLYGRSSDGRYVYMIRMEHKRRCEIYNNYIVTNNWRVVSFVFSYISCVTPRPRCVKSRVGDLNVGRVVCVMRVVAM